MIEIYETSTTKSENEDKKLAVERLPDILPGSFEFPDEGQKYDWQPAPKEEVERSVPEGGGAPIAVF